MRAPCVCGCGRPAAERATLSDALASTRSKGGRPGLYHEPACRQRAWRRRKRCQAGSVSWPPRSGVGPVVLSLCDWSGSWSEPWRAAGYDVLRVDLREGYDVRDLPHPGCEVDGILAAPPCTRFCRAAAHTWQREDPAELRAALAVVDACLRFVATCHPRWWALENPPGRLDRWLGPPAYAFQPWWFGDPHTKHTYLWGTFRAPARSVTVPPEATRSIVGEVESPNLRAITPPGFARAFCDANLRAITANLRAITPCACKGVGGSCLGWQECMCDCHTVPLFAGRL